jgi:DNA-directed RNA polymerase specialized sigma24 family protein
VDYLDTRTPETPHSEAERHVTALYQAHALSLARLALLMLGDRHAAQDVVQDAFFGLYRR